MDELTADMDDAIVESILSQGIGLGHTLIFDDAFDVSTNLWAGDSAHVTVRDPVSGKVPNSAGGNFSSESVDSSIPTLLESPTSPLPATCDLSMLAGALDVHISDSSHTSGMTDSNSRATSLNGSWGTEYHTAHSAPTVLDTTMILGDSNTISNPCSSSRFRVTSTEAFYATDPSSHLNCSLSNSIASGSAGFHNILPDAMSYCGNQDTLSRGPGRPLEFLKFGMETSRFGTSLHTSELNKTQIADCVDADFISMDNMPYDTVTNIAFETSPSMNLIQYDCNWLWYGPNISYEVHCSKRSILTPNSQTNTISGPNATFRIIPDLSGNDGAAGPEWRQHPMRKRHRHSEIEWKEADEHIKRMYFEESHTAEEIVFALSVIHGFDAALSTIEKRCSVFGKKQKRCRSASKLPEVSKKASKVFAIVSEDLRSKTVEEKRRARLQQELEKEKHRQIQMKKGNKRAAKKRGTHMKYARPYIAGVNIGPFLRTVYIHQEELFHAIDGLVKGWFASKNRSWSIDTRHFHPPPGTAEYAAAWQLMSDQVHSLHMLFKAELYHHANYMLKEVLSGLSITAQANDPSFLVHFGGICHALAAIPTRSKGELQGNPWLGWFLRHFSRISSSALGSHPLVGVVDSMLQVWSSSPRDIKPTLALGQWKVIDTMGCLIDNTHPIILNMGSRCTKNWKSKFSASSTVHQSLHQQLCAAKRQNIQPKELAEVSLDYLYAASREKYNEPVVIHETKALLSSTTKVCRGKVDHKMLQDDAVTRAFVFSTELMATHHLETWRQPEQKENKSPNRDLSYNLVSEAIEILRRGDVQCRVRAAALSKRLSTWIKSHGERAGDRPKAILSDEKRIRVMQEKSRSKEILQSIPERRIEGSRRRIRLRGSSRWRAARKGQAAAKDLLLASL
ncbi:hypothetical protein JX265_013973 [Neoarthrinium moseri]|uniref:Uncharacterized protein n=1 Tax=Neoarthrinium moseri TaxID=1658444 RepID=A0A9P9W7H5_9PEZI|nr:hypothetical protein JX265_013973 [Neoarthrinium moseri]